MLKLSQKKLRKVFLLCEYKEDTNYSVKVCRITKDEDCYLFAETKMEFNIWNGWKCGISFR